MKRRWLPALLLSLMPMFSHAQEFISGPGPVTVVELYTSEGCSSCPPAEDWLSGLTSNPALFKTLFPLAFHVDYWNSLGWRDRFSTADYSLRQKTYARQGDLSQVYTPGFVVNGEEWSGWFHGQFRLPSRPQGAGILDVRLNDPRILQAQLKDSALNHPELHVAYLGFGLQTPVRAGENSGRLLHHDFVVLYTTSLPGQGQWQLALPPVPQLGQQRTALVAWISADGRQGPLVAAGGYLH